MLAKLPLHKWYSRLQGCQEKPHAIFLVPCAARRLTRNFRVSRASAPSKIGADATAAAAAGRMLRTHPTSHATHFPRGSAPRAWMMGVMKMTTAKMKVGTATIARRTGRPVTPERRSFIAVPGAGVACSWGAAFFLASSHPLAAWLGPEFSLNGCASEPNVLERDLRGGGDAARDGRISATSMGAMVKHRGRGEARARVTSGQSG